MEEVITTENANKILEMKNLPMGVYESCIWDMCGKQLCAPSDRIEVKITFSLSDISFLLYMIVLLFSLLEPPFSLRVIIGRHFFCMLPFFGQSLLLSLF